MMRVQGSGFRAQEKRASARAAWFFGFLVLCFVASLATAADTDPLLALAAKCDELRLKEQAAITRAWPIVRHPGRQYLFIPAANDPAAPKSGADEVVRLWHAKFLKVRRQRAAALFAAAKKASNERQPARSYQLLHEALREDPDHAEARHVLGYIRNARGQWTTPEW